MYTYVSVNIYMHTVYMYMCVHTHCLCIPNPGNHVYLCNTPANILNPKSSTLNPKPKPYVNHQDIQRVYIKCTSSV